MWRLDLQVHDGPPDAATLEVAATAGGSLADAVKLPGLAPAALRLEPCRSGVVVTATVAGVRVGGHAVPPGGRRLLRPGERAEVGGARVGLPAPVLEGTRAAAGALLAAGGAPGPSLLVLSGPLAGARLPLRGPVVLGRGRGAGLRLPDPEISRRHARVVPRAGRIQVEDLGSKNGVRVNGVRVESRPVRLSPGDLIDVGDTAVTFDDPAARAAREVPPAAPVPRQPPTTSRRATSRLGAAALLLALGAVALAAAAAG